MSRAEVPGQPPLIGQLDPEATRTAEDVFRALGPRIRTRLVNRVQRDVSVRAVSVEWTALGTATDRLSPDAIAATFRVEPSGFAGMVVMESMLMARMIGLMLGEAHDAPSTFGDGRAPSRFDLNLARRIAEDVVVAIEDLMPELANRHEITAVGTALRIHLGQPRTSYVGTIWYEVEVLRTKSRLAVIVPSEITRLVLPKRSTNRSTDTRAGIERVMPLRVEAVAEIARLRMSLGECHAIKPGKMFDLGPAGEVTVTVGGRPVLIGEAGVQDGMRSVQILHRVDR